MVAVDVRRARDEELPAIVAALGQDFFFRDRLRRQREGRGDLLIAWCGPEPVGDIYLHRELPDEEPVRQHLGHTPTLSHLEVRPDRQGQGIGTALIAEAERIATELGYHRVGLGVGVDNPAARRLYERLGFRGWEHGLVTVEWDEPDGTRDSLVCDWLAKNLDVAGRPGVSDWRAFDPGEAATLLRRLGLDEVPWYVAGGWAVDLHLGRTTREHEDLEVAIPRACFARWRTALGSSSFDLYDVGSGRLRRLGPHDQPDPANHQVWLCADGAWRMDTFLELGDATTWVFHRHAGIRAPLADAVARSRDGVPYLRPQFVLLGKAKHARAKDEADLASLLPALDVAARHWLAKALRLVHPGHPWIGRVLALAEPTRPR